MEGYLVIGIGRFGKSVARTLYENNKTVLAIDENEEVIQQIIDNQLVGDAVVLIATDENALKKVLIMILILPLYVLEQIYSPVF